MSKSTVGRMRFILARKVGTDDCTKERPLLQGGVSCRSFTYIIILDVELLLKHRNDQYMRVKCEKTEGL